MLRIEKSAIHISLQGFRISILIKAINTSTISSTTAQEASSPFPSPTFRKGGHVLIQPPYRISDMSPSKPHASTVLFK